MWLVFSKFDALISLILPIPCRLIKHSEQFPGLWGKRVWAGNVCARGVLRVRRSWPPPPAQPPTPLHHRGRAGQRYGHTVDICSSSGVLSHVLTRKPPFPTKNGASHSEFLRQVMTKTRNIAEEGIDFLYRMLDRNPETTATMKALQNHPWISPEPSCLD